MTKNIIFDFGDVFINLDKAAVSQVLERVDDQARLQELFRLSLELETGAIGAERFLGSLQQALPAYDREGLLGLWNATLLDFPTYRLDYLEKLAATGKYRLYLLSNTNEIHIAEFREKIGPANYQRFRDCFEGFYLSHEIHLRKPDPEIFEFVLERHGLQEKETLFIDDSIENIETAASLGIRTWHLQVGREDITELNSRM